MSRYVDLNEKITAQFYDQEYEEWTMQTVTIKDVLDSICDEYTVLSSAQPEPKRGKWLPDNNNYIYEQYVCSECKNSFNVDTCMGKPMWNFCPNCGADMRDEQDG